MQKPVKISLDRDTSARSWYLDPRVFCIGLKEQGNSPLDDASGFAPVATRSQSNNRPATAETGGPSLRGRGASGVPIVTLPGSLVWRFRDW
jgi:hypothetical protein